MVCSEMTKRIVVVGEYKYIPLGAGYHYAPQRKLWISRKSSFFSAEELVFPLQGVDLRETQGGNLLLVSGEYFLHLIYIPCGYRGGVGLKAERSENSKYFLFDSYESPNGNLGISKELLVLTRQEAWFQFHRDGRLYGAPATITIRVKGGELEEYPASLQELEEVGGL